MQVMVASATACAAVGLAQYLGSKHTFTVATVGVATITAYGLSCAFLTMHEQASKHIQKKTKSMTGTKEEQGTLPGKKGAFVPKTDL